MNALVLFPKCRKAVRSRVVCYRQNAAGITATSPGKPKSIDSCWVTEQLLRDRRTLGMDFDGWMVEVLLSQEKVNYNRIRCLERTDIGRAVFLLTTQWFE